ncbi:UNVERIFIED_CONTAM: hypothetical protein Sangu_0998000 [Sesamum angustifolium]|uniref:Uncharacterized protein n=1 Tax=Sesamum angustifolium TaxID=2727405 RepID=A0AAW2PD72_9LAMI
MTASEIFFATYVDVWDTSIRTTNRGLRSVSRIRGKTYRMGHGCGLDNVDIHIRPGSGSMHGPTGSNVLKGKKGDPRRHVSCLLPATRKVLG